MSSWRHIDPDTVECQAHGRQFRSGDHCPDCPAAGSTSEKSQASRTAGAAARAVASEALPAAKATRRRRGDWRARDLAEVDHVRRASAIVVGRLIRLDDELADIADRLGDGKKTRNNKQASRLQSRAKVIMDRGKLLGDYVAKALRGLAEMQRPLEERAETERRERIARAMIAIREGRTDVAAAELAGVEVLN